jgi:hypothetical protein
MAHAETPSFTRWEELLVSTGSSYDLACGRCGRFLLSTEVALYSRLRPHTPFEAWCAECALILIEWACMGANRDGFVV